jgi:hypothetical protein
MDRFASVVALVALIVFSRDPATAQSARPVTRKPSGDQEARSFLEGIAHMNEARSVANSRSTVIAKPGSIPSGFSTGPATPDPLAARPASSGNSYHLLPIFSETMNQEVSGIVVTLPQNWVNTNEWIGTTSNVIDFPASGIGGTWVCSGTTYGPYTAGSQSGLQQAINDSESCRTANGSGTLIIVPAGTLYSGSSGLTLPQTAGDTATNFIVLTSSSPLPIGQTVGSHGIQDNIPESDQIGLRNPGLNGSNLSYQLGTTVTPLSGSFSLADGTATSALAYNDIASMWTVECTATACNGFSTANYDSNNVGPHNFAILNAEIRPKAGLALPDAPVKIGSGTETQESQIPSHIHFAYDYVHGDWTDAPVSGGVAAGPPTGTNVLPNDFYWAGCVNCSLSYSYVDKSLRPGGEGHANAVLLGLILKFDHNWIEGMSSGTFCGGQSSTLTLSSVVGCTDVEDRGNRYTYPYSWLLAEQAGYCANGKSCDGNGYVRKNGHELKNAQRYLFDGNIVENVDNSGAQNGTNISFKTANQSSDANGQNYGLTEANTTITNNVLRNSCNGPSLGDRSQNDFSTTLNGNGVTFAPQNYLVEDNLLYGISTNNPGCKGSTPQYGMRFAQAAGSTWAATVQRDSAGLMTTLTLEANEGGGQSDTQVGDPVQVDGCSDTSFNTTATVLGPPALSGTNPNGLTIVYSNPGTPGAGTGVTGCVYNNVQGYPIYVVIDHNSDFLSNPGNDPSSSADGGSAPYILQRDVSITNSIFANGLGINSTFGEGTRTEEAVFDVTTLAFNNNLFPGRDKDAACPGHKAGSGGIAKCYTEYNPAGNAVSPPVTIYGVPTSFCTGNDPTTESCVGVVGAMSMSSFPTILPDWHDYRLCHSGDSACNNNASPFSAGQMFQAADGTDLGFSPSSIDLAETQTQYPGCSTDSSVSNYCGPTGPYPDVFVVSPPTDLTAIVH